MYKQLLFRTIHIIYINVQCWSQEIFIHHNIYQNISKAHLQLLLSRNKLVYIYIHLSIVRLVYCDVLYPCWTSQTSLTSSAITSFAFMHKHNCI